MATVAPHWYVWVFLLWLVGLSVNLSGCSPRFGAAGCAHYQQFDGRVSFVGCTYKDKSDAYYCRAKTERCVSGYCWGCPLHRSDDDHCVRADVSQVPECMAQLLSSFPVNSTVPVFQKKDVCYTHHYVERLSLIGLVILVLAGASTALILWIDPIQGLERAPASSPTIPYTLASAQLCSVDDPSPSSSPSPSAPDPDKERAVAVAVGDNPL